MSGAVRVAVKRRAQAVENLATILALDYPPGANISWRDEGHMAIRHGVVRMNTHGDRIKVLNCTTGGERFIRASQIVS